MGLFPLRLSVDLREDETVKALRAEVAALTAHVALLEERCHASEYSLMFEYHVNEQLIDLCREAGVDVPRRLFHRPERNKTNGC